MAGAQNVSDLMYRASRAVGDMAAWRDWASVAALRDVAAATERGLAAGKTASEAGGDTGSVRRGQPYGLLTAKKAVEVVNLTAGRNLSAIRRESDVYVTEDGRRFVFPKGMDSGVQDMTPERALTIYEMVPERIRARMQETVQFVDFQNPEDAYWSKLYKGFKGSYATDGGTITFYASTDHNNDYVARAMCHEVGHYVDAAEGNGGRFSDGKRWSEAMRLDKAQGSPTYVTEYASTAPDNSEDFAESVSLYGTRLLEFKNKFPNRFEAIRSLFGM